MTGLTIVSNGFNRATSQSFLGLPTFSLGFGLMKDHAKPNVIVTLENRRCGLTAHITINAFIGNIESSRNIFRESGIFVSHNFICCWFNV